jgi:hypothetical protein
MSYVDPLGLWSFGVYAYNGLGGGFVITGDGLSFTSVGFRAGVGVGAGFAFNPFGGPPDDSVRCAANSIGVFAEASGGIGPVSAGAGVNAGLTQQIASGQFNGYAGAEPSLSGGQSEGGWPIQVSGSDIDAEAEASAGVELTHYFNQ